MSFQAYLDTVKTQTGKSPEDFRLLAAQKGIQKHGELVDWLKSEYSLGHGHANAIAHTIEHYGETKISEEDAIAAHFTGGKSRWREAGEALIAQLSRFGPDVNIAPGKTYINLQRGAKKFGILQVSAAERIDIGIKLKSLTPDARLEAAGAWNSMVTQRVRISDPQQIDAQLLDWLKQAYEAAA
jgi:hypothetical protein